MKRIVTIWLSVVLMFSTAFVFFNISDTIEATLITVDDSGGQDYTSIQAAIDNAIDGDVIYVYSGLYNENVTINKRVSIIGENQETTIIDTNGLGDGSVIHVTSNWANITNFTTINSVGGWSAGISVDNPFCKITNCTINGNYFGIYISDTYNCTISNVTVLNHLSGGIFAVRTDYISIQNSTFIGDMHHSIEIRDSVGHIFANNHISGTGITTDSISNSLFLNNVFEDISVTGLHIYRSPYNTLKGNQFINNTQRALFVFNQAVEDLNQSIDQSNIVNGQPVHYYYGLENVTIQNIDTTHFTLAGSKNVTLRNITSTSDGMMIFRVEESLIEDCVIYDGYTGITIQNSKNNRFSRCEIYSTQEGINIYSAGSNTYENMTIMSDESYIGGTSITGYDTHLNTFKYNNFNSSVHFWGTCLFNKFFNNNLTSLDYVTGYGNEAWGNNFFGGTPHTHENPNDWDNGSIGNYYEPYAPIEDLDGNGIGDSPILLGANNTDNYPLAHPYAWWGSVKPSIELLYPENGTAMLPGGLLNFSVWDGNLDLESVSYMLNGLNSTSLPNPYDISTLDWTDGSFNITLEAEDLLGAKNQSSFIIDIDTKPPEIKFNLPNNTLLSAPRDIVINVSDPHLKQVYYDCDAIIGFSSPNIVINISGWLDKTHNIEVQAEDYLGHFSSTIYTFTLDTTPPQANAGLDRTIIVGVPFYLNGSDSSDNFDIDNYTWTYSYNGTNVELYGPEQECLFSIPGEYEITLAVTDSAGNLDDDIVTITILEDPNINKEIDTDSDGIPDIDDPDDDNDGYLDLWEIFLGTDPLDIDDTPLDTDEDGLPDGDATNTESWMDTDDDGDGVPDTEDFAPLDPEISEDPNTIEDDPGLGQYWWIILIFILVPVVLVVAYMMKKKEPPEVEAEPEIEEVPEETQEITG